VSARKKRPAPPGVAKTDDVEAMIRVDHAGEYGAVRIYEGQLAVFDARGSGTKAAAAIRKMAEQEQHHLKTFDRLVNERRVRPTALEPVWRLAGFALGAATALMGEKATMACTAAVEEVIDDHYAAQLERLNDDKELKKTVAAKQRPIVMITSNNEKELPDAFLRRCFFHYIRFPDPETMERIVQSHLPDIRKDLAREALQLFYEIRDVPGLRKRPATSELIDWLKLLMADEIPVAALRSSDAKTVIPPLHGALLKNEQDIHLFERLAFLHRRGQA